MSGIEFSKLAERFNHVYWRAVPHVFIPANWGRQYCELCKDPRRRVIHLTGLSMRDPRRFWVKMGRGYPVGRRTDHTWFRVDGWNESDDASCSYACNPHMDFDGAVEMAQIMQLSGDSEGRIYEHYLVAEMFEHAVIDVNYHPVVPKEVETDAVHSNEDHSEVG